MIFLRVIEIHYRRIIIVWTIFLCSSVLILSYFFQGQAMTTTGDIPENVRLPIVMYHHFLKDSKSWGKYVISPDDFERDIVYLKEKGYEFIVTEDLIDFAYGGKPLPPKPIMLTFDDGYLSNYTYILPILEKHNAKAVISIIGTLADQYSEIQDHNVAYGHLSWEEIKELVDSPYVEIQNHSYNMHNIKMQRKGCGKLPGESLEEYKRVLIEDIAKTQEIMKEKTGYTPTAFAYPFGEYNKDTKAILKEMGFLAAYICHEKVNELSGDKEELYFLKRYNRPSNIDRNQFFGQFEE